MKIKNITNKKRIFVIILIIFISVLFILLTKSNRIKEEDQKNSFIITEATNPIFVEWIDNEKLLIQSKIFESTSTIFIYNVDTRNIDFETYVNPFTQISLYENTLHVCSTNYLFDPDIIKTEFNIYKIDVSNYTIQNNYTFIISDDVINYSCDKDNLQFYSRNPNLLFPQKYEYSLLNNNWLLKEQATTSYETINNNNKIIKEKCNQNKTFCFEITDSGYLIIETKK